MEMMGSMSKPGGGDYSQDVGAGRLEDPIDIMPSGSGSGEPEETEPVNDELCQAIENYLL